MQEAFRATTMALAAVVACMSGARSSARGANPILLSETINDRAPYRSSHASTIVETASRHLVAAWFGGTAERNPDVGIWVARRGQTTWEPAVEVANGLQPDGKRYPTWNPVLFQAPNGPLILFYKVGPSPSQWWGMVKTSADEGRTWTDARRLPDGILGPIKDKPVVLRDGSWLAGSSNEAPPDGWRVHFERSRDAGRTWEKIGPIDKGAGFEAIQPTILFPPNGKLEALCRTKQGVIAMTWSSDNGSTWTPLAAAPLPNPNSGIDAVTLADGRLLLVYNHSAHEPGRSGGPRYPLDVAISGDGLKWEHVLVLEDEPRRDGYAYPAVIQTSDGLIHITYTWDRKTIKHVVIDAAKLAAR
jgi:predicted neuraminidase